MTTVAEVLEQVVSAEEYLALEKMSEIKHEYYYGKLIPVAGEKKRANRIANNINLLLSPILIRNGYEVFLHDVKAAVKPGLVYRYPDYMVAMPDDRDEYLVFEPIMAVEVASEDSITRDRGKKLDEYTRLPSMQYYLIIYQEEMLVEAYTRVQEKWTLDVLTQPDDMLHFPLFEAGIALHEVYTGVLLIASSQ